MRATVTYRGETFATEIGEDRIVSIVAEPGRLRFRMIEPPGSESLPDASGKATAKASCFVHRKISPLK